MFRSLADSFGGVQTTEGVTRRTKQKTSLVPAHGFEKWSLKCMSAQEEDHAVSELTEEGGRWGLKVGGTAQHKECM